MFVPPTPYKASVATGNSRVNRTIIKVLPGSTGCSIRETKVKIAGNKVANIISNPLRLGSGCVPFETDQSQRTSLLNFGHGALVCSGVILAPAQNSVDNLGLSGKLRFGGMYGIGNGGRDNTLLTGLALGFVCWFWSLFCFLIVVLSSESRDWSSLLPCK